MLGAGELGVYDRVVGRLTKVLNEGARALDRREGVVLPVNDEERRSVGSRVGEWIVGGCCSSPSEP